MDTTIKEILELIQDLYDKNNLFTKHENYFKQRLEDFHNKIQQLSQKSFVSLASLKNEIETLTEMIKTNDIKFESQNEAFFRLSKAFDEQHNKLDLSNLDNIFVEKTELQQLEANFIELINSKIKECQNNTLKEIDQFKINIFQHLENKIKETNLNQHKLETDILNKIEIEITSQFKEKEEIKQNLNKQIVNFSSNLKTKQEEINNLKTILIEQEQQMKVLNEKMDHLLTQMPSYNSQFKLKDENTDETKQNNNAINIIKEDDE